MYKFIITQFISNGIQLARCYNLDETKLEKHRRVQRIEVHLVDHLVNHIRLRNRIENVRK